MSSFSFLSHLQCARCGQEYPLENGMQLCVQCGSPLFARYDLDALGRSFRKDVLRSRTRSLWRYHELLPVQDKQFVISLNEQMTPLIPLPETARDMDLPELIVKDESTLPSGTFKARGASVGISRALEMGVSNLALPTNGNAGAAWALYSARAGIKATIVMPRTAPLTPRKECSVSGADLFEVNGTIADAGRIVSRAVSQYGWYDVSTLKEPYRLEGKKTMGFEIAEQFSWSVPDVIVYPTGGGAGVIGIIKAMEELQQLGWIGRRLPRIAIVQAEGCAPLVRAYEQGKASSEPWENPETVAFGMRVPKALGDFLILDIIRKTNGVAISVSDSEITRQRHDVVRRDGLHVCPEGAAALAGVRRLREKGWVKRDETVLVMNTGSGLKYVDQIEATGRPIGVNEDIVVGCKPADMVHVPM